MSSKVITNFVKMYKSTIVNTCKESGIAYLPYPKTPINTDKCIYNYHKYLEQYVNDTMVYKNECYLVNKIPKNIPISSNYMYEKLKDEFPKKYFNYASR